MNIWFQLGVPTLVTLVTLIVGYFVGRRGRSNAIATTVEKDWLHTVAEDLAEFTELQIDIVWKRWRLKVKERTDPETSSHSYENEAFRSLQEASWKQTFRSDFLKSKLLLMLDDHDVLQKELIQVIDEYAKYPDLHDAMQKSEENVDDPGRLRKGVSDFDQLLREKKPQILNAGRRVLAAKREAIRRSI